VTPGKQSIRAIVREFPHDRRSDADLVRDVILGNEDALVAVWRRHGPAVRRTLFAQLGRDESVDDLLQEVFLAFTHGAARITQPDRLRSYLMAAAVRQARQAIRDRSRRRRWLGLLAEDRRGASFPPAVHSRDALRRLRDILDHLPDRLRESFILRFVEGLPTVEVAEIRGVSLATAKRDVAKAHDRVLFQSRRDPALMDYLRGPGSGLAEPGVADSGLADSGAADSAGPDSGAADSGVPSWSVGDATSASDEYAGLRSSSIPSPDSGDDSLDDHLSDESLETDVWSNLDGAPELSGVEPAPRSVPPEKSRARHSSPSTAPRDTTPGSIIPGSSKGGRS